MISVSVLAWVDVCILGIAIPYLFYRLQAVPWTSWGVLLPTVLFAVLTTRASVRHGVVSAAGAGDAS